MELKSFIKASAVTLLVIVLMAFMSVVSFAEETTPTWEAKKSMSVARWDLGTATVNGKIYAIGGSDLSKSLNLVEEYDPLTDTWTTKAPMKTPRSAFATAVYDGKIYVIGGYAGADSHHPNNSYLNSVEMYDPETDTWTNKNSMPTARELISATVLDGKIYIVGGYGGNYSMLNNVEVYDPVQDSWTKKANYPIAISGVKLATVNNKIYAIGNGVREYDKNTDTWSIKKSMQIARSWSGIAVLNNEIFIIGGETTTSASNVVEKYDCSTDIWTKEPNLSIARMCLDAVELNGKIYAIGGLTTNMGGIQSLVEELTVSSTITNPTLTATASAAKAKIGDEFTTDIAIHNVTNICAEDIKVSYDSNLFEYVGATAQTGLKIYKEDTSTPGTVRFIVACQGKDNVATGDKNLIQLKFKAKSRGVGKVDIIKGRIADNATLEMDVADENCGEATIEIGGKDVNRTDSFTLLDLGIDAYYFGFNAADTDTTKYDADLDSNGKIDDGDLTSITESILLNKDYPLN